MIDPRSHGWKLYAISVWLCVASAAGCHKNAPLTEQPRVAPSDSKDVAESVPLPPPPAGPNYAAMMADDPGRCLKQVIVGNRAIAFEFNRDYYWYVGEAGPCNFNFRVEPFYHLIPKHYLSLHLGRSLSCGRNRDGTVECWGVDSDGATNPKPMGGLGLPFDPPTAPPPRVPFDSETPLVLTDLPNPIQQFALGGGDYCALAAGKVVCPAPRGHGTGEVRGLGAVKQLMWGGDFGCAGDETQIACWGQYSFAHGLATVEAARTAAAVALPAGLRVRSLRLGDRHACVLGEDGAAYCFGVGNYGAWGTGAYAAPGRSFPVSDAQALTAHYVATLGHDVRELGAGSDFSCALKNDGSVWCWGDNSHHIASDQERHVIMDGGNKKPIEPLPVQRVDLGTDNRSLKVGLDFACVEKNDGALWCWGDNQALELPAPFSRFEPPHFIPLPAPRCAGAN